MSLRAANGPSNVVTFTVSQASRPSPASHRRPARQRAVRRSPSTAATSGGTTAVHFSTVPVTTVTDNTTTSVTVVAPTESAGVDQVSLTASNGTSDKVTFTIYTSEPVITGITPPALPSTGGETVTIHGHYLGGTTAVTSRHGR